MLMPEEHAAEEKGEGYEVLFLNGFLNFKCYQKNIYKQSFNPIIVRCFSYLSVNE